MNKAIKGLFESDKPAKEIKVLWNTRAVFVETQPGEVVTDEQHSAHAEALFKFCMEDIHWKVLHGLFIRLQMENKKGHGDMERL